MARRDQVGELIAIKERSGRRGGRFPDINDLHKLKEAWHNCAEPKELFASLLPARIVTFLEVFCRYWLQKLIDRGQPYDERAMHLKIDVKVDLELARSLHGQNISVGLLISHSVTLLNVGGIAAVFSTLLADNFFDWLSKVRSRHATHYEGESAPAIVSDVDQLNRVLARTFDIRHILIHEFPVRPLFDKGEIDEMLEAAIKFIDAVDEGLSLLLYGKPPMGQQAMNLAAREESKAVVEELDHLVDEVAKTTHSETIRSVHQLWTRFAEAEAHRNAEGFHGGTAYPLFYHVALKAVASDRVRQLKLWLEEMTPD